MEKIQQLALLLKQVQAEKCSSYLHEQYCVDLIKMACDKNLISVVHSLDGKEYITISRIKEEILEKTCDNGGRLAVTELSHLLNVDYTIIKKLSLEICKDNLNLTLLNEELMSISYVDRIVSEMQDILDANGHLSYSEIHKRFLIPIDFMHQITKERSGQTFHGKPSQLFNGSFITDFENNIMQAKVAGLLFALRQPCSLMNIAKNIEIQSSFVCNNINILIKSYPTLGTVRHGVFFPRDLYHRFKKFIINEIENKGYLLYKTIKFIPVDSQTLFKDIFKSLKNNLYHYSKVVVNKQFIDKITSKIFHIIDSEEIFNTNNLFQDDFDDSDSAQILEFCFQQNNNFESLIYIPKKSIIFSSQLILLTYEKIIEYAKEKTFEKLCCDKSFCKQLIKIKNDIQSNEDSKNKRKVNKINYKDYLKQIFPLNMFNHLIDPNYELSSFEEVLCRAYQNFIDAGLPLILDLMSQYSIESEKNIYTSLGENNKERIQILTKNVVSRFNLMIIYVNSALTFEKDISEKIIQYILKNIGSGISENILRIYIYKLLKKLKISEYDYQVLKNDDSISTNDRNSLCHLITDSTHNKYFSTIFQSLQNYDVFLNSVMIVKDRSICDIPLKLNLKKQEEKSAKEIHKTYQIKIIEKFLLSIKPVKSDISSAFIGCISLMLSNYCDQHLIFPPRYISCIIDKFINSLDSSNQELINHIKNGIVHLLSSKISEDQIIPESLIASLKNLCKQAKEQL